jgi:sodium-dependent phosphate transporter
MGVSAFAIGANDSANAWGTSVGSGAISLKKAVLVAALTDFLGAITLGYGVSDTIQKGVSDVTDKDCWACGYCDSKISVS